MIIELMHLNRQFHGRECPAIILVTAHSATAQLEYVPYDPWHWFTAEGSFTVDLLMFRFLLLFLTHRKIRW
jgi:hypothetical protein